MKTFIGIALASLWAVPLQAAQAPDPDIKGNTSTYSFTTSDHFELSKEKGAYFNGGTFPTVHMGVACGSDSDPACREKTFDNGSCFLKTGPIFLSSPGRVEMRVEYIAQALRRGFDAEDVAFDTLVHIQVDGKSPSGKFSVSENIPIKSLTSFGSMADLDGGRHLLRFNSQGNATMNLGELASFANTDKVSDLRVSFCSLRATLFAVKSVQLTVIQDGN